MRHPSRFFALAFALLLSATGAAATLPESARATGPHIEVQLLSETAQLQPGRNWLGVWLKPDPEWHTYWRNPGDSGEPPKIEWKLPTGASAGDIHWPLPHAIPVAHLVNYGYEGDNLLMVPIDLPDAVADQETVAISVDLSWLVCKEDCIPGWATLSNSYPVATNPEPGPHQALFADTRDHWPEPEPLNARHEITDTHIVLSAELPDNSDDWHVYPFDPATIEHNGEQQITRHNGELSFLLPRSEYFTDAGDNLRFLASDGDTGYYLDSRLNVGGVATADIGLVSLALLVLMAFAGGLILNLMPCVLPVLSMKALSLQHGEQQGWQKWGYALGVLASFNLFALGIILLKQSGQTIGWGFHMQYPWVIALLAYLFTLIALLLFDLVPQINRVAGIGQSLTRGQGFGSQFFTGVLAVIVASPCTAPFMAAALGVAMVSDAPVTLALFNALAIGFALPLSLIFIVPAISRWLPKPGPWMETFRQFLAFPMLATVIWLVWIYLNQTSAFAQLWLLSGLLMFSLAIWLAAKVERPIARALLAVVALAALAGPLYYSAPTDNSTSSTTGSSIAYSAETLEQLLEDRQVVLVNMTADWCITCKVNEQVAFKSQKLRALLASEQVHYMVGDWTNKNDQILTYLQSYQRSGVPLYVVYSGTSHEQVLPQILTADLVIDAIQQALAKQNEVSHETTSS